MGRLKLGRVRLNITLPPSIVAAIDSFAEATGRTRSDTIQQAWEAWAGKSPTAEPKRKRGAK